LPALRRGELAIEQLVELLEASGALEELREDHRRLEVIGILVHHGPEHVLRLGLALGIFEKDASALHAEVVSLARIVDDLHGAPYAFLELSERLELTVELEQRLPHTRVGGLDGPQPLVRPHGP